MTVKEMSNFIRSSSNNARVMVKSGYSTDWVDIEPHQIKTEFTMKDMEVDNDEDD